MPIVRIGNSLKSPFLLLIRIIWGHQFIVMRVEYSLLYDVTLAICGVFLIAGFASRLAAIPPIIGMMIALSTTHAHIFSNLDFIEDPSILIGEKAFSFLMASLIVFIFGPGWISIDGWLKRRSQHWQQY